MMTAGKRLLKQAMIAIAPETTIGLLSARARAHSHRLFREWGMNSLNDKLIGQFGSVVHAGPFRGMKLTPMTHQEHLSPYLLGSYEEELHPWIETVANAPFTQIIDVGAKFGYYAVGLAKRAPRTSVVAFDTDWWARKAMREMVAANGTLNVSIVGFCSPRWLDKHLVAGALILSDCEGYEGDLLTQTSAAALATATLLIETHENLVPGVSAALRGRFAQTHEIAVITAHTRNTVRKELEFLTPAEAETAIYEVRGPQEWLILTPQDRTLVAMGAERQ